MMDKRPLLLDSFCGAGGAGEGYHRAGFRVVGCDLNPKPLRHNPHECYQGDALTVLDTLLDGGMWNGYRLSDFSAIHASPPCQDYSPIGKINNVRGSGKFPRLIIPIRERLIASGKPWIIENVRQSMTDMLHPVMLCGTAFGLRVQRHRLFDSSHYLFASGPCRHRSGDVSVRCKRAEYLGVPSGQYRRKSGRADIRPLYCPSHDAASAMTIDWMNLHELGEAIPPAYTEWLGRQLLAAIQIAA